MRLICLSPSKLFSPFLPLMLFFLLFAGGGSSQYNKAERSVLRITDCVSCDGALQRRRAIRRNHAQCAEGTKRGIIRQMRRPVYQPTHIHALR